MPPRIVDFVLRKPWWVLIGAAVVTLAMLSQLDRLYRDTDANSFIPRGDDALENIELVERIFGTTQIAIIAVFRRDLPQGIYNPSTLALLLEISEWLRSRPEFETGNNADLRSLASVNNILGRGDDMIVEPFLEDAPEDQGAADAVRAAMEENPIYVGNLVSEDGSGAMIMVRVSEVGLADREATYTLLHAYLEGLREAGHPEDFHLAGRPVVEGLFEIYIPAEGRRLMPLVLAFILAFLYLSFRTKRALLLPLVVVIGSELWMFGFLALWGRPVYSITSILPILIIAMSVADSIHLLAKYYDAQLELPDGDRLAIVGRTMQDMARPVLMTSVTTAIGFLSMTTSAIRPISDFGIIMAVGVAAAYVLSIAVVPALLVLLPLRPSPLWRRGHEDVPDDALSRVLAASARLSVRSPVKVLVISALVFAAAAGGIHLLVTDSSQVGQFRPNHPLRVADREINRHFAGATVLDVAIDGGDTDALKDPDLLRRIAEFQAALESDPMVGDTLSIAELLQRMNEVLHGGDESWFRVPDTRELVAQYLLLYSISGDPGDFDDLVDYDYRWAHVLAFLKDPGTVVADAVVEEAGRHIESLFGPLAERGVNVRLSGRAYMTSRLEYHIVHGQLSALLLCIPLLTALNWATFRSLSLGILSIAPVVIAIVCVYGLMGYVGIPADIATVMLGGMTLGIGVDFAIHYIHKYRHCRDQGLSHAATCNRVALTAGRALFFNALVLIGGFLVMLGARFYPQVKLGVLVATTMVVCYLATIYVFPAILGLTFDRRSRSHKG